MKKISAGILIYRRNNNKELEFLLVHPGGPFWSKKDIGSWDIPKGGVNDGEEYFSAAKREAREELGFEVDGNFIELGNIVTKSGKTIYAWGVEASDFLKNGDKKIGTKSNMVKAKIPFLFMKEWPEVDRGEFFNTKEAKTKIFPSQIQFLERLETILKSVKN
ncbi:MAG: NUDIX domain-containing protein [Candidatus Paceibacterota bacterium]|jgi:predicted NUDIX family NTP pyrophosphohydrolase